MSKLQLSPDGFKIREIKVESFQPNTKEGSKIRAFFKVRTSDGFLIAGFKIMDGKNDSPFVGFPADLVNGQWRANVYAAKAIKQHITTLAITEMDKYAVRNRPKGGKSIFEEEGNDLVKF